MFLLNKNDFGNETELSKLKNVLYTSILRVICHSKHRNEMISKMNYNVSRALQSRRHALAGESSLVPVIDARGVMHRAAGEAQAANEEIAVLPLIFMPTLSWRVAIRALPSITMIHLP